MENKRTLTVVLIVVVLIALYFLLRKKKTAATTPTINNTPLPPQVTLPVTPMPVIAEVGSIADETTDPESPVTAPQLPPQVTLPVTPMPVIAEVGSIADETAQDVGLPIIIPQQGFLQQGETTDPESPVTAPQLPPQVTLPVTPMPVIAEVGSIADEGGQEPVYKPLPVYPFYENDFFLTQNIID